MTAPGFGERGSDLPGCLIGEAPAWDCQGFCVAAPLQQASGFMGPVWAVRLETGPLTATGGRGRLEVPALQTERVFWLGVGSVRPSQAAVVWGRLPGPVGNWSAKWELSRSPVICQPWPTEQV